MKLKATNEECKCGSKYAFFCSRENTASTGVPSGPESHPTRSVCRRSQRSMRKSVKDIMLSCVSGSAPRSAHTSSKWIFKIPSLMGTVESGRIKQWNSLIRYPSGCGETGQNHPVARYRSSVGSWCVSASRLPCENSHGDLPFSLRLSCELGIFGIMVYQCEGYFMTVWRDVYVSVLLPQCTQGLGLAMTRRYGWMISDKCVYRKFPLYLFIFQCFVFGLRDYQSLVDNVNCSQLGLLLFIA